MATKLRDIMTIKKAIQITICSFTSLNKWYIRRISETHGHSHTIKRHHKMATGQVAECQAANFESLVSASLPTELMIGANLTSAGFSECRPLVTEAVHWCQEPLES